MRTYSSSKEFSSNAITRSRALVVRWRHYFLGPLLSLLVVTLLLLLPTKDFFIALFSRFQDQGAASWVWIILLYAAACIFFLPKTVIALSAGFLFGLPMGFLTALAGCLLGATPTFYIGRALSRQWRQKLLAGDTNFRIIAHAVKRHGFKIILLCRLNPIFPFGLLNYISGATTIRFPTYIGASLIGFMPLLLVYVYLGQAAKTLLEALTGGIATLPAPPYFMLGFVLFTAILTMLTVVSIRRELRKSVPNTRFL